jgi:hypothetical protein
MLVLKFISWPQADNHGAEKVVTCDSYEVVCHPDRSLAVNTFRGAPTEAPTEEVFLAREGVSKTDASKGSAVLHYRRLYVMNDQGKTIDSYSAER